MLAMNISRRPLQFGTIARNAMTAKRPQAWKGLIGLWSMLERGGGVAYDLSGRGNHGIHTTVTYGAGYAIYDGAAGKTVNLDMQGVATGIGSIVMRARLNSVVQLDSLFHCRTSANKDAIYIRKLDTQELQLLGYNTDDALVINQVTGDNFYSDDVWYTVAVTWDSVNAYMYWDGVQILVDSAIAGTLHNIDRIYIAWSAVSGNYTPMQVDWLAVYNRMISAAEVAEAHFRGRAYWLEPRSLPVSYAAAGGTILPQITQAYMRVSA